MTEKEGQTPSVLNSETRKALELGLKMADEDPRRWTLDEALSEAKKMAKEWQKKGASA